MKLLLTSTGLTNPTLEKKFLELVGKSASDIRLAYIPTALNTASMPDKRWAVDNIVRFDKLGIGTFDIVDFPAIPQDVWLPRLADADVLFFEAGTPTYLMDEMNKVGMIELLLSDFQDTLIVGASSGSTVFGKNIIKRTKDRSEGYKILDGFSVVDFSIRPHYLHPDKELFDDELIAKVVRETGSDFYAIDDQSAIVVVNDTVNVVSEGAWKLFQK